MNKYIYPEVLINWSEDDQAYLAECPKLKGCIADGATIFEAAQNLDELIEIYLEEAEKQSWDLSFLTKIEFTGDKTIKVAGSSFRCGCGCNVFRSPKHDLSKYKCNACGEWYAGED